MAKRSYTNSEHALIGKLYREYRDDWKKIEWDYNQAVEYHRTATALKAEYRRLMRREKGAALKKRNGFGWDRIKTRLEKAFQRASRYTQEAAGLAEENRKLRRELKETKRTNRQLAAQVARVQRALSIFQAPLKGERGKRTRSAMVEHAKE